MREVDQELFDAVKQGNLGRVKRCLDRGANIHARSLLLGYEPIHLAAREGHQEVVEFFLGRGASVNDTTKSGSTPLHYVALCGRSEVAEFLIEKGASIEAKDKHGRTPLDIAREEGHMEIVNILDGTETEITESESSSVCSSLKDGQEVQESDEEYFESECDELEAAKKDIIEHLKYRCNCVFIVTGKDRDKNCWHYVLIDSDKKEVFQEQSKTGSMNAADYGKILYSGWGDNPPQNIRDKVDEFFNKKVSNELFVIKEKRENKNVYHYILVDPDKKEMFQERSKTSSALIRKIEDYGRILYSGWGQDPPESIPDRIARAYFCTNEKDLEGEFANLSVKDDNALYDAARNGELETVKYLIKKGVNVNSADKNGWTSLHHAAYGGNLEVVKCLIDSRADLHVEDTVCGRKPVHIAAREGNTGIVKLFLSKGVGANDADKNSWTPLHYAAWNGHSGTANLLINQGADIHAKDAIRGKKPIHIAAEGGCTSIIELFVSSGISIDDTDKEGRTLLYYAAWKGHLEAVKFLAGKGANIHAENTYGTKPIHVTTMEGHREIIEFLLSKGVDVDDTNKNGWTPLHWAAQEGKLEIAKFLIEEGADINAKNNDGKTPLDIARKEGHTEILDILDDPKTGRESPTYTSLHDAAKKGDLEAIKYLIRKGADINDPNENGWTPLHITAVHGHKDVVEFFFNQEGVDIDIPGRNGWTPLHLAAEKDHLEVIQFLLDKKANIHAKNTDGSTALHIAVFNGHKDVVEFFLNQEGIDIDAPAQDGFTLLHYAAEKGQLEVIQFLLDKKANIHTKNANGDMALHLAALNGYKNIVELLLNQEGVDIDAPGWNSCTALHSAAEKGHLGVVQFLLEKGANVDARDNHNKTPLDYAREKRYKEVVEILGYHNFSRIAAEKGKLEAIKYLINTGMASINEHDEDGFTLLHHAASEGELEIVEFLIEKGADTNARDNSGRTPLDCAREEGHTEILDILDGSDTERESSTYTSLHDAAKNGDLEAVKYLISRGADVNDPNEDGWTPLHCAASEGELEVAKFLISKGANIHAKDNTSAGKKPIHVAAMEGYTNIIELFLSRDVNIDDPDKEGRTSLYYAAWKGQLDTVEFLVDKGANVHAEKNGGVKPIHAATDGHQEVIGFLLSKGASVDDRTECGWTPLHFAAQDGQLEVTKFLIEKGADIHVRDNDGKTPLNIARENGHREIVGYLTFRIGKMFSEQDKYSKARQAYQEAFDIQKVVLGPDHPDTLGIRHNMAAMLFKQGKYSEALKIFQAIFEKRRDVLGPDHPDTLGIRHNMAAILDSQGNYSKALEIYQEVFEKKEEILGPNHPDTLSTCNNMAVVLSKQGNYSKALETYQAIFEKRRDILGPDHPDTLGTRHNMAVVLFDQNKYSEALRILREVLNIQKTKLGSDHPDTLLTIRNIGVVSRKQASRSSIQLHQKQEKAYLHLSQFVSCNLQAPIEPVKQGLYLPSFEERGVKIDGKCVAVTRGLSQALLSQGDKSFLSNLETSAEIYERIAQGKQISKREERGVFALSKLLNSFEGQRDSFTNSLPSGLICNQGHKTFSDLSSYIAGIKGDFAIHLVTSNHVVAIYRIGNDYAYFDSNAVFVSGLKGVDQLMQVVEKGVKSAGYKVGEKGFLVEHFDVAKANSQLSNEDKQILAKEIKTERQLLAEQDKEFGLIKINGQELSRVQLYDFGTKISVEGGVPLLINTDMNLSSKKLQDHLDKKEVSMTAREYLDHLKDSKNIEEVIQATRFIPFEGSKREIEEAEQTRKLKGSSLEQLAKGTINSILAAVSLASASQSESQLPGKIDNKPETYLNDPIVDKQLQRLPGH